MISVRHPYAKLAWQLRIPRGLVKHSLSRAVILIQSLASIPNSFPKEESSEEERD